MLWTADTVEYRGVSMDAAYSGSTLIWYKDTPVNAVLVTSTTQVDSASTYVLAYPFSSGTEAAVGMLSGLTTSSSMSHMYAVTAGTSGNMVYAPSGTFKLKMTKSSGSGNRYIVTDKVSGKRIASIDSISITYPYLTTDSVYLELTNSVDHHSTGHIRNLEGYTVRYVFNSGGYTIYKYLAGTSNPDEFTFRVATAAGQQIAMLYKVQ